HGAMWFTIRKIHENHHFYPKKLWPETPLLLFSRHWMLWLTALSAMVYHMLQRGPGRRTLFWGLMAVTGFFAAALGSATEWAHTNARLPASLFIAVFTAVSLAEASTEWKVSHRRILWRGAAVLLSLPLFVHLIIASPSRAALQRVTPTASDFHKASRFMTLLRSLPKPLLIPYHPWYSVLAGGEGHFHLHALNDIRAAGRPSPAGLREGIRSGKWKTIVYDRHGSIYHRQMPGLTTYYRRTQDLKTRAPRTFTGNPCRPRHIWVRRR
ncbi:hypothetical protein KKF84_14350, partial [Myxococcota bacterium]|nr:hypothetical protein [Myxococcota bacterium]MBU1536503.1 hypothetical protein [Myxococcota bacterium]